MNNLSHIIRRFNRFELKYLLTLRQAEQVKAALQPYLPLDEYGGSTGSYPLSSLYYDSPDFRCYWEKLDGIKFRRKLRIRQYGAEPLSAETPVFVEIKQRLDRVTQKRRALLPYGEALRLCSRRQMPENTSAQDRAVIDEIYAFLWQYNLSPASIVRYQRQAFIGAEYDLGLRVTFDTDLSGQAASLDLAEPPAGLPLLPPQQVVMEIKVNERIPYWLTELVGAYNLRLVRMSKYCRSIELAQKINTFQSRLALAV